MEAARHAELNELYGRAVREIDSSNWQTAHKLLKQIRKIKFGFLETERLLFKVEAEIRKAKRQSYILQRISLSSKWVKLLLIISSVVLGILFLLSGLPVKYSPSQGKPTFLYSTPDSLVHKGNLRIPPGESFYLC